MSKDNLKQAAERLLASGAYKVLYGVESTGEFFTQESSAKLDCKKGENPVKFEKKEAVKVDETKVDQPDVINIYPANSKDTIAKVKETKTLAELAVFEIETEDRKGVLAEIAKQKEKLIGELDVDQSATGTGTTTKEE
jgi:hypothetical protein